MHRDEQDPALRQNYEQRSDLDQRLLLFQFCR